MEQFIDDSEIRIHSHEINKILLAGAKHALPQNVKSDVISTQKKLQTYLPEAYVHPEIEKVQAVSDTLAEVVQKIRREVAKKLKSQNTSSKEKTKKENVDSGKKKVQTTTDSLKGKVDNILTENLQLGDAGTFVNSEADQEKLIADTLFLLKDKVEQEVGKKLGLLNILQKTKVKCSKSFTELEEKEARAVADALAVVKKWVAQDVADSVSAVERAKIIADTLAALGERVEQMLIEKFGCAKVTVKEIVETLSHLKQGFDTDISQRAFALQINIHKTILKILNVFSKEIDITYSALETLISMSKEQPKILNNDAISIVIYFLDNCPIAATRQQILKWICICMTQCEENRNCLYDNGIIPRLKMLLDDDTTTSPVIRDVCLAIGCLAEYDKHRYSPESSEKARQRIDEVANNLLAGTIYLLHKFLNNGSLLIDILITIQKLLAESYLCKLVIYVKKGKALLYLFDVFTHYQESEELICQLLQLFHIMAANDTAKSTLMEAGLGYIIKLALDKHLNSQEVTVAAFQCIAEVSLRCPVNTALFIDFGCPSRIVKGMQRHSSHYTIQKIGSWIIRIFTTYMNDLIPFLVNLGTPDVLLNSIDNHKCKCEFDAKAALKELYTETDLYESMCTITDVKDIEFPF